MKKTFRGYLDFNENEFKELWKKCLFVFDTNVLLDFYRYNDKARKDLLSILLNIKDRIWIPHQVGLEYSRNYKREINAQQEQYEKLRNIINKDVKAIEKFLNERAYSHINISKDKLLKITDDYKTTIDEEINNFKNNHPNLYETHNNLIEIFENKVGMEFESDELKKIIDSRKERFEKKIPPGYKDKDKDKFFLHKKNIYENKTGDLLLWKQIINKAKEIKNENNGIIFISSEKKTDWWDELNGKTVGPSSSMMQEFFDETDGMYYYMYSTEKFVEYITTYLNYEVNNETIENISQISGDEIEHDINDNYDKLRNDYFNFKTKYEMLSLERNISDDDLVHMIESLLYSMKSFISVNSYMFYTELLEDILKKNRKLKRIKLEELYNNLKSLSKNELFKIYK